MIQFIVAFCVVVLAVAIVAAIITIVFLVKKQRKLRAPELDNALFRRPRRNR